MGVVLVESSSKLGFDVGDVNKVSISDEFSWSPLLGEDVVEDVTERFDFHTLILVGVSHEISDEGLVVGQKLENSLHVAINSVALQDKVTVKFPMIVNDLVLGFGNFLKDNLLDNLVILHELSIFHHEVEIMHLIHHMSFDSELLFGHILFAITVELFLKSFFKLLVLLNVFESQGLFDLVCSHVVKFEEFIFANVNAVENGVVSYFVFFFLLDLVIEINH